MSKQVEVFEGQTLIDIAIQEYGCYEGVMLLLKDNAIRIADDLNAGLVLMVRDEVPELNAINRAVAAFYKANGIKVNTNWQARGQGFYEADFYDDFYHTMYTIPGFYINTFYNTFYN